MRKNNFLKSSKDNKLYYHLIIKIHGTDTGKDSTD